MGQKVNIRQMFLSEFIKEIINNSYPRDMSGDIMQSPLPAQEIEMQQQDIYDQIIPSFDLPSPRRESSLPLLSLNPIPKQHQISAVKHISLSHLILHRSASPTWSLKPGVCLNRH